MIYVEATSPPITRNRPTGFRRFTLRRFLVFVLLVGTVMPTGFYYFHQLSRKLSRLQWRKIVVAGFPEDYAVSGIVAALSPPDLWSASNYHEGRTVVPLQKFNIVRPARGTQQYRVIEIDTTGFQPNEVLLVRVLLGDGCGGSVDLFEGDVDLSGSPQQQQEANAFTLARLYNIEPHRSAAMAYKVAPNHKYQLGVTGSWDATLGKSNSATVSIHAFDAGLGDLNQRAAGAGN